MSGLAQGGGRVMAGPVPATHAGAQGATPGIWRRRRGVDAQDEPGHDGEAGRGK